MMNQEQFSTIVGCHYMGLIYHDGGKLIMTVISLVGSNTAYEQQYKDHQLPIDIHHMFINTKILYDYISQNCTNFEKVVIDSGEGNNQECSILVNSVQTICAEQICRKTILRLPKQILTKLEQQEQKQKQKQPIQSKLTSSKMKLKTKKKKKRKKKNLKQLTDSTKNNDKQIEYTKQYYSNRLVQKILKRLQQKDKKTLPLKKTLYMCKKAMGLIRSNCSLRTMALQLHISQLSARKLKQQFTDTGDIKPDVAEQIYIGKSQGKSDIEMIRQMIVQILHVNPSTTINQMRLNLKSKGIERSGTSIRRYMQGLKVMGTMPKENNSNIIMHYPSNCCLSAANEDQAQMKYS